MSRWVSLGCFVGLIHASQSGRISLFIFSISLANGAAFCSEHSNAVSPAVPVLYPVRRFFFRLQRHQPWGIRCLPRAINGET